MLYTPESRHAFGDPACGYLKSMQKTWPWLTPQLLDAYQKADLSGACQITGGRYFWPLEPAHPLNQYDIEFIAHSLSTKIRWAGVMVGPDGEPLTYSVAQHSVIVADLVQMARKLLVPGWAWSNDASPAFYGLMHDASEAYIVDVPRPLKPHMGNYKAIEAELMDHILLVHGVPVSIGIKEAVRRVDNAMIFWERDLLVGKPVVPYSNENSHPGGKLAEIVPDFHVWDAVTAKQKFLEKYDEIVTYGGDLVPLEYEGRSYGIQAIAA